MVRASDARRRGTPGRDGRRRRHDHAVLGAGAPAHRRGGHDRLGRHDRGRPAAGRGRDRAPRRRPPGRARPGRGRGPPTARSSRTRPAAAWCSTPAPARRCRRSRGSRTRRTGPTATPCSSPSCPSSLVVVGGGPIGCELAQVFARFGVRVTVVQHGPRLVPGQRARGVRAAREGLRAGGHPGAHRTSSSQRASYADGAFTLALDTGEELVADKLLVAAGRTPNLDDLGLETVGLDPAARTLEVDDRLRVGGRSSGRSATSPARARSRTSRCTSPRSRCATSSAQDGAAGALPRGPARDLHRSRRSAASG